MVAPQWRSAGAGPVLLALAVAAALAAPAAARTWDADSYPNPQKDVRLCGRRGVPSFICDPGGRARRHRRVRAVGADTVSHVCARGEGQGSNSALLSRRRL
jgi:hypothetical protein